MHVATIGPIVIGDEATGLTLIAGPCMAESLDLCLEIADVVSGICTRLGIPYVFKASFDKANRTSHEAPRGPGLDEGLAILAAVRDQIGIPVLTDIHEPNQAKVAAAVVDALQIPAFLCRQTDLLLAAASTGTCVNVKKGQFMAPADMTHVAAKLASVGNRNILLTERGISFGYNTLVVDYTAIPIMRQIGYPVCMDVTHAVQRPGGGNGRSDGNREYIPCLARAAAAVGIDALFAEVHPNPEAALSDGATMIRLHELEPLLQQVVEIDRLRRMTTCPREGGGPEGHEQG